MTSVTSDLHSVTSVTISDPHSVISVTTSDHQSVIINISEQELKSRNGCGWIHFYGHNFPRYFVKAKGSLQFDFLVGRTAPVCDEAVGS